MIGILLGLAGYDSNLANAGIRQAASTAKGIGLIYVIAPAVLTVVLLLLGYVFPLSAKEFAVIKTEILRRKGEDKSIVTEEEKRICEKVTGFKFDKLWNIDNAKVFVNKKVNG